MNIKKLDDSELVKIYKKARAKFSLAKECTEEEVYMILATWKFQKEK